MCRVLSLITLLLAATALSFADAYTPIPCTGQSATYDVTFTNLLTPARFNDSIPEDGLVFAPITAVSHSNRVSFLTVRGFATPLIRAIAETGNNAGLVALAERLQREGNGVKTVAASMGLTMPGMAATVRVNVDCNAPFVTALGMIAPSPDWMVLVANRGMYVDRVGRFQRYAAGQLVAYDAGTDSGRDFTNPGDLSLDVPTEPPQNIAPLVEDETDRFDGRVVGKYEIRMVTG